MGDAADEERLEVRQPAGAHDDQVGTEAACFIDDGSSTGLYVGSGQLPFVVGRPSSPPNQDYTRPSICVGQLFLALRPR